MHNKWTIQSEAGEKITHCNSRAFYLNGHRGEAVLRKHLRTFEENPISNIIRRTKGRGY